MAILAVYAYRDVWPLMTFTLKPADGPEGDLVWYKVVVAFLVSLLPLFEPYPYIPYDLAVRSFFLSLRMVSINVRV